MPVASPFAARVAASPLALRLGDPAQGDLTFLRKMSGGNVLGKVTTQTSGNEHFARKQLDGTTNEDFRVEFGTAISSGLFDWIAASWGLQPPRRDGAVLACDLQYTIRSERGFVAALIAETAFPAFDASSKAPGYLTVRLTPRSLLPVTDPATKLNISLGPGAKPKLWLTSNFRLAIDGLDATKVSRIAPFAVRRPVDVVTTGGISDIQAGPIDFPPLRITLSMTSAPSWVDWYEDFVLNGNNGPAGERKGSLTLLAPNLMDELARVDFDGLGIYRLTTDRDEDAPSDQIARMTAHLYCEQMTLVPGIVP
jgi:hypothetical protein